MILPLWLRSSPPSHIPSTLVLRLMPVRKLPALLGVPTAVSVPPKPLGLAEPTATLCLLTACSEQGPKQTGSQELSAAARLVMGPLEVAAILEEAGDALAIVFLLESLLELEAALLEGLQLSSELENFQWGILGMSMQKVVVLSCSPSRPGDSSNAWTKGGVRMVGSNGGTGEFGTEEGATAVATTFPLMAKLCIRSSEEVTESLRKRPYLGLSSMPGRTAWCREDNDEWVSLPLANGEKRKKNG